MTQFLFSSRYDEWTEDPELTYKAPRWRVEQEEQILLFGAQTKDGSIEAEITASDGGKSSGGEDVKEACLLARYHPPESGYCAGIGGF